MSISIQDGGHSIWGKPRGEGGCCSHPHLAATCWLTSCTRTTVWFLAQKSNPYRNGPDSNAFDSVEIVHYNIWKCWHFCDEQDTVESPLLAPSQITLCYENETKRKRKRLNFSRLTWISKLLMFRRILAFYRAKTKYMDWNNLFVSVS